MGDAEMGIPQRERPSPSMRRLADALTVSLPELVGAVNDLVIVWFNRLVAPQNACGVQPHRGKGRQQRRRARSRCEDYDGAPEALRVGGSHAN